MSLAKSQVAIANAHGTRAQAPRSGALPPETLDRLLASLKRQWKCYRKGLSRCQRYFSASAVHASRIETRRLLSVLELLGPLLPAALTDQARRALKRHLDTFNDLRDAQVQLAVVTGMRRDFPASRRLCKFLRKREEKFERKTRKAIKGIKTGRLAKCLAECRREVKAWHKTHGSSRAGTVLLRSVDAAFARTVALRRSIKPADSKTIHCTRIAFKRFRYMVELLKDELPWVNEKLLAALHHYQTMMGEIQDAEVLLRTVDEFLQKKQVEPEAARQLRAECLRRRHWLARVYLDAADQLFEFWPGARPARSSPRVAKRPRVALAPPENVSNN